MAVSSPKAPFKYSSCHPVFWVSQACPRSCSYSSRAVHRKKFRMLQSVCGPFNVTPSSRFSQLKRHKSTFFSAPYPDIYSQDDMSSYEFLVCYERKNHAPSSNLSSSLNLNLRRYESGSLSAGFNNLQRIKEDHVRSLVQDYEQSMHTLGKALPSGHSRPREIWVGNKHIWSQEARVLKEKRAKFKKSEVEVETLSGELKNSPHYDMAYGCSEVGILDGETFSSTITNAADSPCMNLPVTTEEQIGMQPKEVRAAKNVNKNNGKGSTEVVPCINGSSSATQARSEKQERCKLSEEISTRKQNGIADNETYIEPINVVPDQNATGWESRARLLRIYDKVLVVNDIDVAIKLVGMLTKQYRHLIHACDTEHVPKLNCLFSPYWIKGTVVGIMSSSKEKITRKLSDKCKRLSFKVSNIDVKQETPVDHGEIICFSIYSGEEVDFGDGKTCIWVDVLDGGGKELLAVFAPFFEDSSIKKVWHNYSFDSHVLQNYGIKLSGFHADTMHMARLWNSSRRTDGGYSLEALTSDEKVMSGSKAYKRDDLFGKISMKDVFGQRKVKKDGSMGKMITIPPVEQLQREDREAWISYSSLDALSTFNLYDSLQVLLSRRPWRVDHIIKGHMLNFYEKYWKPFGEILVQMETEGMLVDRVHLAKVEKVAVAEQQAAADRFRNWASRYCPDARYMNIGSDTQLRQLFFGGIMNRKNNQEFLPEDKVIRVPNIDNFIEDGKKAPTKYRNIRLYRLSERVINTELFTATGWPSVSGESLKALAGKVSAVYDFSGDTSGVESTNDSVMIEAFQDQDVDISAYGTAYAAFGEGKEGKEACHAIAALCEVCSIDSLISNFILPLQGSHVSGKNGRIHCSLNINTETGRLSARRPNLQNQPALEKDRYKIRQAFIAAPGKTLIVADYGQLELRILAHLADCKSMKEAFKAGGDFHSRTAMNMYPYIHEAIETGQVLLEWHPQPGEDKPPVPLLKDIFGSERRKAKMLNFSIAYGKTPVGLSRDWKVSVKEAEETVDLWYSERKEVLKWQVQRKREAVEKGCVYTLLGRARHFPLMKNASRSQRGHIERAAINTPVQGSAADVAMCAMLEIVKNARLKELGWKLLLQVHDEVILEGPTESAAAAKNLVVECMSKPFDGKNILDVDLAVDAKCAQNWYAAK